jgi:hypothetical protein
MSSILKNTSGVQYFSKSTVGNKRARLLGPRPFMLYDFIWEQSHATSRDVVLVSPKDAKTECKMSSKTFAVARQKLVDDELVRIDDMNGTRFRFRLCDPETGSLLLKSESATAPNRLFYDRSCKQYEAYYRARLQGHKITVEKDKHLSARCLFCDRGTLGISLHRGQWECVGGRCAAENKSTGGIVLFERRWMKLNRLPENHECADRAICALMGIDYDLEMLDQGPVEVYTYTSKTGIPKFRRCKNMAGRIWIEIKDDESPTGWTEKKMGRVKHYLFNLPEVVKAKWVVITEGESDCNAFNALGWLAEDGRKIVATTNPFGDAWLAEHTDELKGKHVLVCPDTDEAGMTRFEHVWDSLQQGDLASMESIMLPIEKPEGKDLRDFLEKEGVDKFLKLIRQKWTVFAIQDEYECGIVEPTEMMAA